MKKVAVVSGKGGTGKTSVSLALFAALSEHYKVCLKDADVEEPNCHLFLKPSVYKRVQVKTPVARVDPDRCNFSQRCAQVCRFGAIVVIPGRQVMVFDDLCNGCGACQLACPNNAIYDFEVAQGWVSIGDTSYGPVVWGETKVGVRSPAPVIEALEEHIPEGVDVVIMDSPPGASDAMMNAVRSADYVIVVLEPTKFGYHDAEVVFSALRKLGLPFGAVINKAGIGELDVKDRLRSEGIAVHFEVPFSVEAATTVAAGGLLTDVYPWLKQQLVRLFEQVVANETD